jgi:LmbE family N-acetylglucosaminyl deacetylase
MAMRINRNTRLLVVAPHPDDEADGVGGLIGKVKKEKGKTLIVYMGVGDSRQLVTGKTRGTDRLNEIKAVKNFTGAEVKVMYVQQDHVKLDAIPQKDMVEKLDDLLERFKPTIVAVPASSSYNQDHRATFDACMAALRPTPRKARHFVENVLEYFEPYFWISRLPRVPNAYLDLGERFGKGNLLDFKMGLYRCHATQVREDPFPRSVENMERLAHIYGKEIGVHLAEAYYVLRATF